MWIDKIKPGLENTARNLAFRGEDAVCGKRCAIRNLLFSKQEMATFDVLVYRHFLRILLLAYTIAKEARL